MKAVITTSDLEQSGPARIVTFSNNHLNRNFTLGQHEEEFVFCLRIPKTGLNGLNPSVSFGKIKKD